MFLVFTKYTRVHTQLGKLSLLAKNDLYENKRGNKSSVLFLSEEFNGKAKSQNFSRHNKRLGPNKEHHARPAVRPQRKRHFKRHCHANEAAAKATWRRGNRDTRVMRVRKTL